MACTPNTVVKWADVVEIADAVDELAVSKGLPGISALSEANPLFTRSTFSAASISYKWTMGDGDAGCGPFMLGNYGYSGYFLDTVEEAAQTAGRLRFIGAQPGSGANANDPCFCCLVAKVVTPGKFIQAPEAGSCTQSLDFDSPCIAGSGPSRRGLLNSSWIDNYSTLAGDRRPEREVDGRFEKTRRTCAGGDIDGVTYTYIWDVGNARYQLREITLNRINGYFGWNIKASDFQEIYNKLTTIIAACKSNGAQVYANGTTDYVPDDSAITMADVLWTIHENEADGPPYDPGCLEAAGGLPWVTDTCGGESGTCGQKLYCNTLLHIKQVVDFVSELNCSNATCSTFGCRSRSGTMLGTAALVKCESKTVPSASLIGAVDPDGDPCARFLATASCGIGGLITNSIDASTGEANDPSIGADIRCCGVTFAVSTSSASTSGGYTHTCERELEEGSASFFGNATDVTTTNADCSSTTSYSGSSSYQSSFSSCGDNPILSGESCNSGRNADGSWTGSSTVVGFPTISITGPCTDPGPYNPVAYSEPVEPITGTDYSNPDTIENAIARALAGSTAEWITCSEGCATTGDQVCTTVGPSTAVRYTVRIEGSAGVNFTGTVFFKTRVLDPAGAFTPGGSASFSGTPAVVVAVPASPGVTAVDGGTYADVMVVVPQPAPGSETCFDYIDLAPLTASKLRAFLTSGPECPRHATDSDACEGYISDPPLICEECPYDASEIGPICYQQGNDCCAYIGDRSTDADETPGSPGYSATGSTAVSGQSAWVGLTLSNMRIGTSYTLTLTFETVEAYEPGCSFEGGTEETVELTFTADSYYELLVGDGTDCIVDAEAERLEALAAIWNAANSGKPARTVTTTQTGDVNFPFDFAGMGTSKFTGCSIVES